MGNRLENRVSIVTGAARGMGYAIPLGRMSTPEEVAAVVVFLACDESSYVTGITIDVSGGRYLR